MTEHAQTRIQGVEVDAAMVPLLKELWRHGIRTTGSCQSLSEMEGAAYVGFVTEEDYEAFKEIVLAATRRRGADVRWSYCSAMLLTRSTLAVAVRNGGRAQLAQ